MGMDMDMDMAMRVRPSIQRLGLRRGGRRITRRRGIIDMDMDITHQDPVMDITRQGLAPAMHIIPQARGQRLWLLHGLDLSSPAESPNKLHFQYLARGGLIRINIISI